MANDNAEKPPRPSQLYRPPGMTNQEWEVYRGAYRAWFEAHAALASALRFRLTSRRYAERQENLDRASAALRASCTSFAVRMGAGAYAWSDCVPRGAQEAMRAYAERLEQNRGGEADT